MVPLLRLEVDVRGEIDAAAMLQHLDLNERLAVLVKAMGAVVYRSVLNFGVHDSFVFVFIGVKIERTSPPAAKPAGRFREKNKARFLEPYAIAL